MMQAIWCRHSFTWVMAFGLVCLLLACDGDPLSPTGSVIPTPAGILEAPPELTVGGHSYELGTYLWRDFQPVSPRDGKPLIALIWLVEADSLAIPGDVAIDYLWIVNGDKTWATRFTDEDRPPQPDYRLEEIARDGPKWGPGIAVDVVVRIRIGSGKTYQILAAQQMIQRTD